MGYVSPYRKSHESFPQPESGDVTVWRYLDLPRLVFLLMARQLPLVRMDLLQDEFEGSVTRGVFEKWKRSSPENAATMSGLRTMLRRQSFVSCWHENNVESEAMWRLYCGDQGGVALTTVYHKLDASLPPAAYLGQVTYVDYSGDSQGDDTNTLTALMHKRTSFQHEREIRVMVWSPVFQLASGLKPEEFTDPGSVFAIEWDASSVIEHVYVSPYAPEWYRDVVEAVLRKFAEPLADRLVWSEMKGVPLF